ncbi:MAG: SUMF1/EgtB/PvdO family nonheme iron enzyme [Bacteroidota bacterium]
MKKLHLLTTTAILCSLNLFANNIQLANTGLSGQNTTNHFSLVSFDVSWENSWRTNTNEQNWDAAWIFIKFRKKGASAWQHATVNYVQPGFAADCGHTAGDGSTIKTSPDGKGIFIYRSTNGIGDIGFSGNKLRWNYGADGVLDTDSVEVNVFATEMVYVTEGKFYAGSNGSEAGHFRKGDADQAFLITSENQLTIGAASENLFWTTANNSGSPSGNLPAVFPKGYKAFYCMKYECSQQQYADFLNNIDAAKASLRNTGGFTGIHPSFSAEVPERAIGSTGALDHGAYADWACLRPMTELEYEKACRGYNIEPVANEYAWGNTTITSTSAVTDAATNTETVTNGNANYNNLAINRPMRCGAYATLSTNRVSSGGTYYGIMEMSGNLYERIISAGTAPGKTFNGQHGDGMLAPDGNSDINAFKTESFYGVRGGGYAEFNNPATLSISSRTNAGNGEGNRVATYGIRCVRTAE